MKNLHLQSAGKIVAILKKKNKFLSVAESCTGGAIAKIISDVSGCSACFKGGIIAYSNDIKCRLLGVSEKTLDKFGAVSEETAMEMAKNSAKIFKTDFAIASTGIAGPTGGSKEKPVGTVWLALATPEKIITEKNIFSGDRLKIREQTVLRALHLLLNEI